MSHCSPDDAPVGTAIWITSSYSGAQGDCLQLAPGHPELAPIRDSKDPAGPVIPFGREAWRAFLAHLG
ncbi:DUF397 domain-containing protein [Streptomyces sp. enrichment culture]|uniref:DUF397 domain-containing protein n=1 Tax=Streptomyces sp. enrichment culture TaxID=1795815 RepID=UPI003F54D12B